VADFVFNNVKGEFKTMINNLGAANDALLIVFLETTGLEADATLKDYDALDALLAGASNEQTNQARKVITTLVTSVVDDTNDKFWIDIADQVYTALNGNAISKTLFCYDGDTTTGTDANIRPVTGHDTVFDPDGTDVTLTINVLGLCAAL
jgi:hypothetical protein